MLFFSAWQDSMIHILSGSIHPLQFTLNMRKRNVQQTIQLSGSASYISPSPSILSQLGCCNISQVGLPICASDTCLRDGGIPAQEVTGPGGDPSPNATTLVWEG